MVGAREMQQHCFAGTMNHMPMTSASIRSTWLLLALPAAIAVFGQRDMGPIHSPSNPVRPLDRSGDREDLNQYCTPGYTVGSSDGDRIDGVYFGTISNTYVATETALGFTDYSYEGSDAIAQVDRDNVYPMTILVGPYDPPGAAFEQYKVWIDFDQDGEFGAFEEVLNAQTTAAFEDILADIYIPADARPGYTGLRIRCVYNDPAFDACSNQSYGEAEDYVILINGSLPCIPYTARGPYANDFIGGVAMNGFSMTQSAVPTHAYSSSLGYGTQLQRNGTATITITSGAIANDHYGAWADWNMDGDFDDGGEELGVFTIAGIFSPTSFNITVPADAVVGYTLLRVRCVYNDPAVTACSYAEWGETQDFTLAVLHGVFPCLPPTAGTQAGDGFTSVTFDGTTYPGTTQWPFYTLGNTVHRVDRGTNIAVDVVAGTYLPQTYDVWLDMNDNGDFADAGEALGSVAATMAFEPLGIVALIPASCPPGQHILRVRGYDTNNGNASACGDVGFGELLDIPLVVEDPAGVCVPYSPYWTRGGDYIDGIELGDMVNISSGGDHAAPYVDFTTLGTTLNVGVSYTMSITGGEYSGDSYHAWIDYNADGDWNDAGEAIGSVIINGVNGTGTISFTVPAAVLGDKRMRVRCGFQPIPNACADATYGETEDYTVSINANTGVGESVAQALSILPMPGDGIVLIRRTEVGTVHYALLEATGRTMASGQFTGTTATIPMRDAANGVYVIVLNGVPAQRFVWQKR